MEQDFTPDQVQLLIEQAVAISKDNKAPVPYIKFTMAHGGSTEVATSMIEHFELTEKLQAKLKLLDA